MGESMSSEPKVITSFEEAPQSLRDKCDKEVLQAFFNAHFSITEKSVNDDKRFYLDDGRRIKDDDILVAYMKDRKVWTEPGVEIRTITGELTNKFGEKKLKDFFAAGFFLTKKRIKKNKWRYYLPDGRCLDSEKKLDDFLLEKLRPAFNKELCDHVIDMAATAIPGVDKSELFISDTENEKAACLNVKLDGKVYKEAILPYVSYEGIISSSLYNNLYSRCTVLHKRNIERFEKSHDLKALKQIAESILLSLQVDEKHKLNENLRDLSVNESIKAVAQNTEFYGPDFLLKRPVIEALTMKGHKVLLIDEIDKTEPEIEHALLEMLSDFAITIPEYGTIQCAPEDRPIVFLTSNNYRELSQPMLRRCSYLYIEHKPLAEIKQIICANVSASEAFVDSVAQVIDRLQSLDLRHAISISEGIEWAKCLIETFHCKTAMDVKNAMPYSIGSLVKDHADEKTVAKAFNLSNGNEK